MGELTKLYFSPFKVKLLSFLIIAMGLSMVYLLLDNYQAEIADLQERVSVCESTQGQEPNKDQRIIFTFHKHDSGLVRIK